MSPQDPSAQPPAESAGPVLFFDGECGLCQGLVRELIRLDGAGRLRYAPLQGPSAQAYLRAHGLPAADFDSLVFVPEWAQRDRPDYLLRTDGVVGALRAVGGVAGVLGWLALVPRAWRDAAYKGVARIRHRLFGTGQAQGLARPEWSARFLS